MGKRNGGSGRVSGGGREYCVKSIDKIGVGGVEWGLKFKEKNESRK